MKFLLKRNNGRIKRTGTKVLFYVYCSLFTLSVILPFIIVLITSLTSSSQIYSSLEFQWLPNPVSFDSYVTIFTNDPLMVNGVSSILRGFGNTLWMTLSTVILSLLVSSLAAYAYEKIPFKGKGVLFMFELATMMIPTAAMTIPSYVFYENIGWTGTVLPIIIPGMFGGASAIFYFRSFFSGISNEYLDAARVDGLGDLKAFFIIVMPLSVPAFVAQFIFQFVGSYNAFMGPLLYLQYDDRMMTLQLTVNILQGIYSDANQLCAISLVALLPLIILYLCSQRLFIEGVAAGGVKE